MEHYGDSAGNWYAIHVRPRCEFSTALILQNKNFEPFVPCYKSKRRWSDRTINLELPLFPGYIFSRFDVKVRLPIITTPGVIRIVGTRKTPWPLQPDEIEAVRRVVEGGCKVKPHPFVAVGAEVCIEEGPLAGLKGIVKAGKNRHLILSIALIQQSISVEVDVRTIRAIKPFQFESVSSHEPDAFASCEKPFGK